MRRVAFLSFAWDTSIICEYYLGLQEALADKRDVQVVIFNVFGDNYASHKPARGAYEVFSLCDPREYDGFIIQGNRTWPPELRQAFVDEVRTLGKPVVSINYDLDGALFVGTNNYQEEFDLVSRVLRERHCRKVAYVNGLKTSVEAIDRAKGYEDACRLAGVTDARFYQANWQLSAGVVTGKRILRMRHDLPDAIFCANDDLAVGVMSALTEAGVRVPEDVMITGFDNREIAKSSEPRMTTVDRDYRSIAATSLVAIERLISGEPLPHRLYSPAKHILARSCRYGDVPLTAQVNDLRKLYEANVRFFAALSDFQSAVFASDSLYGVLESCERYARSLDSLNSYLLLNEDVLRASTPAHVRAFGPRLCLAARGGSTLTLRCGDDHIYTTFETSKLLPDAAPKDRPLYIISPLMHNETPLGIIIIDGAPQALEGGHLAFFSSMLASAIDSVLKTERLQRLVS